MASKFGFQSYPFLTKDEFYEACHHLDRRYCQATLGPLRRRWKLRVCTTLDTNFSFNDEYTTYIQIIRPLEEAPDHDGLADQLDGLCVSERTGGETRNDGQLSLNDSRMIDAEEADQVCYNLVHRSRPQHSLTLIPQAALHYKQQQPDYGHVRYEIHLHPTYQAPCLWFSLHNLPVDEEAFNIDTVFRRLVPDQFKDGLRTAGGIGGISAAVSIQAVKTC